MADPNSPLTSYTPPGSVSTFNNAGSNPLGAPASLTPSNKDQSSTTPGAGATTSGTDVSSSSSGGSNILSTLGGDITNFITGNAAPLAEFGGLAALGLSQANSQKATNDQLAGSISTLGKPYSAAGGSILSQITGGPKAGGALGASIDQQTAAATNLGGVANTYSTGQLTAAQQQQVKDYVSQQRAMIDTQLAQSGNVDGSARDAAYQQIDNNAAELTQNLISGNTSLAEGALSAVQGTYSNLLNQSLSASEFGLGAQSEAVQLQIQNDTALSASLNQLFAGIAQGFGNAMRGSSGGSGGGAGPSNPLGSLVNSGVSAIKNLFGGSGDVSSVTPSLTSGDYATPGFDSSALTSPSVSAGDISAGAAPSFDLGAGGAAADVSTVTPSLGAADLSGASAAAGGAADIAGADTLSTITPSLTAADLSTAGADAAAGGAASGAAGAGVGATAAGIGAGLALGPGLVYGAASLFDWLDPNVQMSNQEIAALTPRQTPAAIAAQKQNPLIDSTAQGMNWLQNMGNDPALLQAFGYTGHG